MLAWDHPPKRTAGEQMDVEVRDLLPRMLTHVGQQAIARRLQAQILGDFANGAHEAGDFGVTGLRR